MRWGILYEFFTTLEIQDDAVVNFNVIEGQEKYDSYDSRHTKSQMLWYLILINFFMKNKATAAYSSLQEEIAEERNMNVFHYQRFNFFSHMRE